MNHPDERTIALYVLNAPDVEAERSVIARHLEECAGCAAVHKELAEHYADFTVLEREQAERSTLALYSPDRALKRQVYEGAAMRPFVRPTVVQRFIGSIVEYPSRWSGGVALIVLALLLLVPRLAGGHKSIAYARAKDEFLIAYDARGDEVWRKHMGVGYDLTEVVRNNPDEQESLLTTEDVDGDGKKEVVAIFGWTVTAIRRNEVVCFDSDGEERWIYKCDTTMRFKGERYSGDYTVTGMAVGDFDKSGKMQVIGYAHHIPFEPAIVFRLDAATGRLLDTYWHDGYFHTMKHEDVDGDGREEILLVGEDNGYDAACLLVLDPLLMRGCAPLPSGYSFEGVDKGAEKFYILFPKTDLQKLQGGVRNVAGAIHVYADKRFVVGVAEDKDDWSIGVNYQFDSTLTCERVEPSDRFVARHRQLEQQGKLKTRVDDGYKESLRKAILYWDGDKFVNQRAMNNRYRQVAQK